MLKQKNKVKYNSWLNERIKKHLTFQYIEDTLFGIKIIVSCKCIETDEIFNLEYYDLKSKLRFAPELVTDVKLNAYKKSSWKKIKNRKKSDLSCSNCKQEYNILDTNIAILFIKGNITKHICHMCGQKYISLGANDIEKKLNEIQKEKTDLIKKITDLCYSTHLLKSLDTKNLEQLKNIYKKMKIKKDETDRIKAIIVPIIKMEDYLIKQYNVFEDSLYLKCEEQIKDYFTDCGNDFFDCGQGYYQDGITQICKIGPKFYNVYIHAEIGSAKQDRGDRLYWVENIENITFEEIEKPKKKESKEVVYTLNLTPKDKIKVDKFLLKFQ